MGSKSKICKSVCPLFPKAENFYDLFGGGFSISHFMIKHRSKDYGQFHFNEIRPGVCELIKDAIQGKYSYEFFKPRFITPKEFHEKKETDAYIKLLWSFGNNGEDYLYSMDLWMKKRSIHNAIIFNEFDAFATEFFGVGNFKDGLSIVDKRLYCKSRINVLLASRSAQMGPGRNEELRQIQNLQNLERLQRLQQLQQLQQLERLHFYQADYRRVPIAQNSVIYCDIPYIGTAGYGLSFNHKEFYDWANSQDSPVFISEYVLDDPRFKCIANFKKRSLLSAKKEKTLTKTEKVFVNRAGYMKLMSRK